MSFRDFAGRHPVLTSLAYYVISYIDKEDCIIDSFCLLWQPDSKRTSITVCYYLLQVLGIIGNVLLQDHEVRKSEFHQLPYQRMFVILLLELNAPEPVLDAINFPILSCFGTVLHDLRPSRASGFAYAWLELVAHRTLMSKLLLNSPQQKVR